MTQRTYVRRPGTHVRSRQVGAALILCLAALHTTLAGRPHSAASNVSVAADAATLMQSASNGAQIAGVIAVPWIDHAPTCADTWGEGGPGYSESERTPCNTNVTEYVHRQYVNNDQTKPLRHFHFVAFAACCLPGVIFPPLLTCAGGLGRT